MTVEDILAVVVGVFDNDHTSQHVLADMFEEKGMEFMAERLREPSISLYHLEERLYAILHIFDVNAYDHLRENTFDIPGFIRFLEMDYLDNCCLKQFYTERDANMYEKGFNACVVHDDRSESDFLNMVGTKGEIVVLILGTLVADMANNRIYYPAIQKFNDELHRRSMKGVVHDAAFGRLVHGG